ncbi:MAG: hypothetical protein IT167_17330 [Bryobacterales bacterium]|nr:hypothetical protein [Bryobacterales bacterium]
MDDVLACFPEHYRGDLDLTVCRSIILAEEIKRRRPGCRIVSNARAATLEFRMILID